MVYTYGLSLLQQIDVFKDILFYSFRSNPLKKGICQVLLPELTKFVHKVFLEKERNENEDIKTFVWFKLKYFIKIFKRKIQ